MFPDGIERKQSNCHLSCNTAVSNTELTPAPTGTPCDDGIFCNGHDFCVYDESTHTSECVGGSQSDPCENMTEFCNSACNETQRNCVRAKGTRCDYSAPLACTEAGSCSQGQCTRVTKTVPPLCTDCPEVCNQGTEVCNRTSGACLPMLGQTSAKNRKSLVGGFWPIIGGITGSIAVLAVVTAVAVVVVVVVRRAGRYHGSRFEHYHRVIEDENRSVGYFSHNTWSYDE